MKLVDWSKIKGRFRENLLLGNGASIAVDERLSYRSLYEQVNKRARLEPDIMGMFESFDTTNFEFIMRLLLEASQVNEALRIEDRKTTKYYRQLRDALISTVREIHPTYVAVQSLLIRAADFLKGFRNVLSLNYDLLVYWSMLIGNEKTKCQWFKDCFVNGVFEKDFRYLYRPYPPATGSTLVFYPHGNLFLATNVFSDESKLSRTPDDYLLETVLSRWLENNSIPLFVSEGTSREKLRAITRSSYLNSTYDSVVSKVTGSLVIYGWSFGDNDEHILHALDRQEVTHIAVSVHSENPNWESFCDRVASRLSLTHNLKDAELVFFDSHSSGCWIY